MLRRYFQARRLECRRHLRRGAARRSLQAANASIALGGALLSATHGASLAADSGPVAAATAACGLFFLFDGLSGLLAVRREA